MRTDDFDKIKPQDTTDGIPDVVQVEEQEEFSEFDSSKGKSLGEVFRDNPFLKIVLVGAGVVAVAGGLFMFGGSSKKEDMSKVGTAVQTGEAPGMETSETYRNAVNDVNQQRLESALRTGESTIPIPTSSPESSSLTPVAEEPPVDIEDPLAGWKATAEEKAPEPQPEAKREPSIGGSKNPQIQAAAGPDPAAVDALSQAMASQMQSILDKHTISGPQIIQVTSVEKPAENAAAGGASANAGAGEGAQPTAQTEPEEVEILIPAGTIAYAQTLTEANSDAPGPVLARIASGPLAGSRILGSFTHNEEYLTLNFNTVVVDGVSQAVNAVALDPKTTLPAVASEVDHRYWKRFVLPAAARFIEGMGDAIAQREQTDISISGDTVTSSKPDLNTREEVAAGFAESTSEIADQLDNMADDTKILVKVRAGTAVGILFLEPVTKQK